MGRSAAIRDCKTCRNLRELNSNAKPRLQASVVLAGGACMLLWPLRRATVCLPDYYLISCGAEELVALFDAEGLEEGLDVAQRHVHAVFGQ